ncbi:SCO2322 family protein [Austwickia sp. TVS 96-490-7B]|uniref:SCO2322 family protein n=1 Tax=Austwickia sp. TVS 96-490-7B TaxID=2830843 RepID=UPI001C55C666|nr:SCO2322 family protein [Austwickia sp. TVS 96-490-7B]
MTSGRARPLEEVIPLSSSSSPVIRPLLPSLGVAFLVLASVPGPAVAETTTPSPSESAHGAGQRSWVFFSQKDKDAKDKDKGQEWAPVDKGPYSVIPAEGTVDGWRFVTAPKDQPRPPRTQPTFADICGKTAGEAGKKRIGVVVDYGRKSDGPSDATPPSPIARCALVPSSASSSQVLTAVAQPTDDGGRVCAIDNYPPGKNCAETVASIPTAAASPDDKVDISVSAPLEQPKPEDPQNGDQAPNPGPSKRTLTVVAAGIVAVVGGSAWLWRRRKGGPTVSHEQ